MSSSQVLVAVPTTGRRHTLFSLIEQLAAAKAQVGQGLDALLIVNAPEVPSRVRQAAATAGVGIAHVPQPGLARARNAALDAAAGHEFLVFVDDDEIPQGRWPMDLVGRALETGADVAMGAIRASIDGDAPWWLTTPEIIRPALDVPPGPYEGEVYSSNTLIRMRRVTELGLRFDEAFNASGAEDTDFFRRFRSAGAKVIWVPDAEVIESLDAERMHLSWYLRRCASESAMFWVLEGRTEAKHGRSRLLARRAARAGRGIGRGVTGIVRRDTAQGVAGLSDLAIAAGTMAAVVGWRPAGYRPPST